MTKDEAEKLLALAPRGDKPSRINPHMTEKQAVEIIEKPGFEDIEKMWGNRARLLELRIYQAACNLRRPTEKSRERIRAKAGL